MPQGTPIPLEVRDDIHDMIIDAISRRLHKGEIKKLIYACFANSDKYTCCAVTAERLITEAREKLRDRMGITKEEGRNEAIAFYESVIRDPQSDFSAKIKAQERIDKILGLEFTGAKSDTVDEYARKIREAIADQDKAYG